VDGWPRVNGHSGMPRTLSRKLFLPRKQRNPTKCDYTVCRAIAVESPAEWLNRSLCRLDCVGTRASAGVCALLHRSHLPLPTSTKRRSNRSCYLEAHVRTGCDLSWWWEHIQQSQKTIDLAKGDSDLQSPDYRTLNRLTIDRLYYRANSVVGRQDRKCIRLVKHSRQIR